MSPVRLSRQSALVLRPLFVVVLLDHLTDLVARHFEATDVQGASQLCEVDEAVTILVDLTENQAPLDLDDSFRRFEDVCLSVAGSSVDSVNIRSVRGKRIVCRSLRIQDLRVFFSRSRGILGV